MSKDAPKSVLKPELWVERTIEETQTVYTDWAASYEAEVSARGYHTPRRIAEALTAQLPSDAAVLDFGCGTGLSGKALRAAGVKHLHGTDINDAMLAEAAPKGIYDKLWLSAPGDLDVEPGTYDAIVAAGVISLGAAPPETIDVLIAALAPGQILALSFNGPTLEHGGYEARLDDHVEAGRVSVAFREDGPHLDDMGMRSDVILLRRL